MQHKVLLDSNTIYYFLNIKYVWTSSKRGADVWGQNVVMCQMKAHEEHLWYREAAYSHRARRFCLLGFVIAAPLSKQISVNTHVNTHGFRHGFCHTHTHAHTPKECLITNSLVHQGKRDESWFLREMLVTSLITEFGYARSSHISWWGQ